MDTQVMYDAFLAKISSDEWAFDEEIDLAKQDWLSIMKAAMFLFKYPRILLTLNSDETEFENELTNDEIQVLSSFMRLEWMRRCAASWDQIKVLYSNKDFSAQNHLDRLMKLIDQTSLECDKKRQIYSIVINGAPYDFKKLAGK